MCCDTEKATTEKIRSDIPQQGNEPGGSYGANLRPMTEEERVNELFTHKFPTHLTGPKFETIRETARHMAKVILMNVPSGADRYIAIQKLREVVMIANAGIANNGLTL
jgi:hypothetical protein